ncbi:unnamed protein product, partial [Discosporangium mesarthrocarpum]
KGRWRIFKPPLQYWHGKRIDNILFTCCLLQNMPHAYDGLEELEVNTDWTGDAGLHDAFYTDFSTREGGTGGVEQEVRRDERFDELRNKLIEH